MLVKMRPYSFEEVKKVSNGIVTDTYKGAPYSVTSQTVFGNQEQPTDHDTKKRSCDIFSKTGLIMLDMPVPNFFLCGNKLELLNKIMPTTYLSKYGIKNCSMSNLINCNVIYDAQDGMLKDINKSKVMSETYDIERYEIGGSAIKALIDEFDVKAELMKEILNTAITVVSSAFIKTSQNRLQKSEKECISITSSPSKFHIIEDFYVDLTYLLIKDDSYPDIFMSEEFMKNYESTLELNLYRKIYNRRITYLLSLYRDKSAMDSFRNLVQNFMIVMPVGFRPDTELGINLVSNAYNKVIKANNSLRSIRHQKNQTLSNVINSYKALVDAVRYVTVDYSAVKSKKNSENSYRDIVSSLKSKDGLIRSKMQSVTVDNSGRTVIIVDPNMSIDSIGVPYTMLRELLDVHYVATLPQTFSASEKIRKLEQFKSDINFERTKKWIDNYVKNIPIVVGRQPTLWKLGIQGFKIVPVEGAAIVLSPLQVSAFNADFDGDQMHCNVPVTPDAVAEIFDIMMNIKNIYLTRDGSCHMYPRHEIIYGLWRASKAQPTGKVILEVDKLDAATIEFVQDAVINDKYILNDVIKIGAYYFSLGQLAVKTCAGVKYADFIIGLPELVKSNKLFTAKREFEVNDTPDGVFTEDWSIKLLTKIHDSIDGGNLFVKTINNYTRIGTAIATNYPPNVSITKLPNIDSYVEEFNNEIKKVQHYYDIGFETEVGYRNQYSRAYAKLKDKVEKSVLKEGGREYIGDENGFRLMSQSKCRGNKSTMMQMFGLKGRVMKNSNEAFNSVITHSMVHGLTGLEHFLTAYGGRQGQIDKSIETSKPGYISRIMSISDDGMVIRSLDCKTTDGLWLTYDRLRFYLAKPNMEELNIYTNIKKMFEKMVVGRYLVEKTDSHVNEKDVDSLFKAFIAEVDKDGNIIKKNGCRLRSPITCKNPCCQKCYGIDLSTHSRVAIGRAVGFDAAQSIGQPGTQLTMKNFQGGGVVSEGNLTSSFELMQKYLELTDLNSSVKTGRPIKTDMLAPVEVDISEIYIGRNLKQVYLVNSKNKRVINRNNPITMYAGIKLKKHVMAGENIQEELGDLTPENVLNCRGVDELIFYLVFKLYNIFNREVSVDFKHFETLIASMIFYTCRKSVGVFKAGLQYTLIEYMRDGGYNTPENFVKCVIGVKSVPDASKDCLRSILFEDLLDAVRKHIITSPTDEVKDPWVRLSLGLMPNVGSCVDGGNRVAL